MLQVGQSATLHRPLLGRFVSNEVMRIMLIVCLVQDLFLKVSRPLPR